MNERRKKKHPECNCDECTLYDRKFVKWWKPQHNQMPIMAIGQAPGEDEAILNRPFIGSSGKMLWSMMKGAGINRDLIPLSNLCSCYPEDDREPTTSEIQCCKGRVKREIQEVKPKLIIALGSPALTALTGKTGIMKHRGQFLALQASYDHPCQVLACLHPSFCMRSRQWITPTIATLGSVHPFLAGKPVQKDEGPDMIKDPDAQTLQEYLYSGDDITDCDTETTGLDTLQDNIIGYSFCNRDESVASVALVAPKESDPRWPVIKEFLENSKQGKCWQNGSYDTEIARTHGIHDAGFVYDTRLGQQLLSSDLPSDLDFLRAHYTKIAPYKPARKDMQDLTLWSRDKLLEYAAWDAYTTRAVRLEQEDMLSKKEIHLMQNLLIPLVRAIGRIERRGFKVNVDSMAKLMAYYGPKRDEIEEKFWKIGLNPRSNKQIKEFFNLPNAQKATLQKQIKRDHPQAALMEELVEFKSSDKLLSTYVVGIYKRMREGRIHTHLKLEGTGTGRLSSENPNLQNVPELMRIIYEADEGYDLWSADYSQLELWVIAVLTGGGQMLKDLQDGLDIHYISCQLCYPNIPLIHGNRKQDFTKLQALIAKAMTFGTVYGRSPRSIAMEFGVTVIEAEGWQKQIINKYKQLKEYRTKTENGLRDKGFIETPFGRRRYMQSILQGLNFPVQSSASDITLGSIVGADKKGIEILISVHDDIVFQAPKGSMKEVLIMQDVMERKIPELEGLSFGVEYSRGSNWYEAEDVTDEVKQARQSRSSSA